MQKTIDVFFKYGNFQGKECSKLTVDEVKKSFTYNHLRFEYTQLKNMLIDKSTKEI